MGFDLDLTYFIFIFARMVGCIMFNGIFGRANLPRIFQFGLAVFLSIAVLDALPVHNYPEITTSIEYMVLIMKELFLGFVIGTIMNLFSTIVIIAGEATDMQIGLAMAKIYDPKSNISMGISASILNVLFMLLFFTSNCHITLIKIFLVSCKALPIGQLNYTPELFSSIVELFSLIFIFSMKLIMPILAIEFITEMCMGVLMKAIPQIHIFVVNIPLKIVIGLVFMMILLPAFSSYIDRIFTIMFETVRANLNLIT